MNSNGLPKASSLTKMNLLGILRFPLLAACFGMFGLYAPNSVSGPIIRACDTSAVSISQYSTDSGASWINLPGEISGDASACLGVFSGNDPAYTGSGDNRGALNDGFLNDSSLFPSFGAFIDAGDPLLDLDGDGNATDPGWIFAGRINPNGSADGEGGTTKNGTNSYQFDVPSFLSLSCSPDIDTDVSCGDGSTSGFFTYTPPATNPDDLLAVIGTDKFFDEIAVVFKAATEYAIYNFELSGLSGIAGPDVNLSYRGEWDMRDQLRTGGKEGDKNAAGLSHATVWFRDPTREPSISVPAPGTLGLMGLGLAGLGWKRRKQA